MRQFMLFAVLTSTAAVAQREMIVQTNCALAMGQVDAWEPLLRQAEADLRAAKTTREKAEAEAQAVKLRHTFAAADSALKRCRERALSSEAAETQAAQRERETLQAAEARRAELENQEAEQMRRLQSDKSALRTVASAWLCWNQLVRRHAKTEIAKEKHYAAQGGGVVDMGRIYALQQRLRSADEDDAGRRSQLTSLGVTARPCADKEIQDLLPCIQASVAGADRAPACETPLARVAVDEDSAE